MSVAFSPDGRHVVSSSWESVRIWDTEAWACQQVIKGFGDASALASGAADFSWKTRALEDLETLIVPAQGGKPVAWFPALLGDLATHPSGRAWVGAFVNHLYFIRLEGNLTSNEERPRPGS
jgi:hypothetical protein